MCTTESWGAGCHADINGSYQTGTGTNLADMPNGTTPDRRVYALVASIDRFISHPLLLPMAEWSWSAARIQNLVATWTEYAGSWYYPLFDTWSTSVNSAVSPPARSRDAQSTSLENGTLALAAGAGANAATGNLATFNPTTLTFTALTPTGKADSNNEENWNILPDGTLLTVDARISSQSEIYDPVTNTWGDRTNTVVNLADTLDVGGSFEVALEYTA